MSNNHKKTPVKTPAQNPTPKKTREITNLSYVDGVILKKELHEELKDDVTGLIYKWIRQKRLSISLTVIGIILGNISLFIGAGIFTKNKLADAQFIFDQKIKTMISETNITDTVNRLMEERATAIIRKNIDNEVASINSNQIDPLKLSFSCLQKNTSNTIKKYDALIADIEALSIHTYASLGSRKYFLELAAKTNNSELANILLTDLNLKYADFKNKCSFEGLPQLRKFFLNPVTKREFLFPAEDLYQTLTTTTDNLRQVAMDSIANRRLQYFVEDLVTIVNQDQNLFTSSCAVSTIEKLTGKKFSNTPLFSDVDKWWQAEGKTNKEYLSPFPLIAKGRSLLDAGDNDGALKCFQESVKNRHGLADPHNCMGYIFAHKGDEMQATNQYMLAMSETEGCYDAMLTYAAFLLVKNKTNEAIEYIDQAMPFIPDNAQETVSKDKRFSPLRDNLDFLQLIGELPAGTAPKARGKRLKVDGIDVFQVIPATEYIPRTKNP